MAAPPGCALDESALRAQAANYQELDRHGKVVVRDARRLAIEFSGEANANLIRRTIATEAACSPFLEIDWHDRARRLTITVSSKEHEPVIETVAGALAARSDPGRA